MLMIIRMVLCFLKLHFHIKRFSVSVFITEIKIKVQAIYLEVL